MKKACPFSVLSDVWPDERRVCKMGTAGTGCPHEPGHM